MATPVKIIPTLHGEAAKKTRTRYSVTVLQFKLGITTPQK